MKVNIKLNKSKIWKYAFPFRQIWEWSLELFQVRITNGKVHYEKSSTKALRSIIGMLAVTMTILVIVAFWQVLFGNDNIQKRLTPSVLASFLGLQAVIMALLGWLQNNYTEHKKTVVSDYMKYATPENIAKVVDGAKSLLGKDEPVNIKIEKK